MVEAAAPMKIALFHGYELTSSGSNEYTRYLSRALADAGHEVHVLCREPAPEQVAHATRAVEWSTDGVGRVLFDRSSDATTTCVVHVLPHASVRPVYLTDKQRPGPVKSFATLTDAELQDYHDVSVAAVTAVLEHVQPDVLHANHLVYQPVVAADACRRTGTPFIVYPHGSAIEYTLRADPRFQRLAEQSLDAAHGWITGNVEVRDRILDLYPGRAADWLPRHDVVGVGVDTELFQPVEREHRAASVAALADEGFEGKGPELRAELTRRLQAGEYEAVTEYRGRYGAEQPDTDLVPRLDAMSWDEPVLLFVGSLTSGKGVQGLITAFSHVLHDHPGAQLLVVGNGSYREVLEGLVDGLARGDEPLVRHLVERGFDLDRNELTGPWPDVAAFFEDRSNLEKAFAPGGRLRQQVQFVGRLRHDLLQRVFPCADVAVFPSVVPEAYPLVLMESLANGVLPAVTDFSGFADGLRELEGLLGKKLVDKMRLPQASADRVAGIARRLGALLDDPDRMEVRPRLRQIARERYDWTIRAEQMVHAYARALQRTPVVPAGAPR